MAKLVGPEFFEWKKEQQKRKFEEAHLPIKYIPLYHFSPVILNKNSQEIFAHVKGDDGEFSFRYESYHLSTIKSAIIKLFLN